MYIPDNLCQYVRKLSLAYFLTGLLGFIFTWITTSFLWFVGAKLGLWFDFFILEHSTVFQETIGIGAGIGFGVTIILAFLGITHLVGEKWDAYRHKKWLESFNEEKPRVKSAFAQWLADRHDKICRQVTFK